MIPAIKELNFPTINGKQYATLTHATVTLTDMGEKTISTQVAIDGDITPDFSYDWMIEFQGEEYIMPLRIPQGTKENTNLNTTIDLTFQHWAIYQLKRWPFVTIHNIAPGTYLPDREIADVQLNLRDFCNLFGQVLEYYYGGAITIDFNDDPVTGWKYKEEATLITINHSYIWDVLIKFYELFGVRWAIEPREDNEAKGGERYVIKVGYPTTEVDHIFEYGFRGGLLKVERQVQSDEIRNIIKGRGGETNIPLRYFKNTDPDNPYFRPDPDWIQELETVYFTNLMPATFRSYVQGWKAAHISRYPGYTAVGESNAYAPWAYRKGYTDTKFSPVEFVTDEITLYPHGLDHPLEILPGYTPYVKKDSSLDKYGPLPATLDNNDDIYPTLQGTGLDIAVDIEHIDSDDVAQSTDNDTNLTNAPQSKTDLWLDPGQTLDFTLTGAVFTIPPPYHANFIDNTSILSYATGGGASGPHRPTDPSIAPLIILKKPVSITIYDATTHKEHSASAIPPGNWYYVIKSTVTNNTTLRLCITVGTSAPRLEAATIDSDNWKPTFDIWVQNIWNTRQGVMDDGSLSPETPAMYAERVWRPILGDREKNTAKVIFTSGPLAHQDYEFTIHGYPVLDTGKSYNGLTSHWRITLVKSDAELEATGLYIPSTIKQGEPGNTFVFIGTEMTHSPYVITAEQRLDDSKKDHLLTVKEITPTFVVTTDRVRLNSQGHPDALINQLRVGNTLRLADKRLIQPLPDHSYHTLYLQSITYNYRRPTGQDAALNPDIDITLGTEYATTASPVAVMQSTIDTMQRTIGSISHVEQIVRAVSDPLYLRKDGINDRSYSPTQFHSLVTSTGFRPGIIGGTGWGFYKDENGNSILDIDRINIRQEMQVNTLVINQAQGRGGMEIDTAAHLQVTQVNEYPNHYVCYFDQHNGTVANLFNIGDIAYSHRFNPYGNTLSYYKRRVIAVTHDSISLTKPLSPTQRPDTWPDSGVDGSGIPAVGDNIIHYGSYTNPRRQFIKIRDIIGGSYERYLMNLDSVTAPGNEFYFVGRQGQDTRWFIGYRNPDDPDDGTASYIEYTAASRRLRLEGVSLSIGTTIGNQTIPQYISNSVTHALSQVPIGTVNLLNGTARWNGLDTNISQPLQLTGDKHPSGALIALLPSYGYYWTLDIEKGQTYTFSAYVNASARCHLNYWPDGTAEFTPIGENLDIPAPGIWTRVHYTIQCTTAGTFTFGLESPSSDNLSILTAGFKVETGNIASDWTPSPHDIESDIAGFDYLRQALRGNTVIGGGVILTSHLRLGTWDTATTGNATITNVYAGINGVYKNGRTIAAWYGGDMVDRFDNADTIITPTPPKAANTLFRMDGTGYLASGNIRWDSSGNITANALDLQTGRIAGFKITHTAITNDNFNATNAIVLRNDNLNIFAGIGDVLPPSIGFRGVGRFENFDASQQQDIYSTNYGITLGARGAHSNIALNLTGGHIRSLAIHNTIIDPNQTSITLTRDHTNIIALNTNTCHLYMPVMQLYDDGHIIRIKRMRSGPVVIHLQSCYTPLGNFSRPLLYYDNNIVMKNNETMTINAEGDAMEFVWVRDTITTIDSTTYYGSWIQYKFPRDW